MKHSESCSHTCENRPNTLRPKHSPYYRKTIRYSTMPLRLSIAKWANTVRHCRFMSSSSMTAPRRRNIAIKSTFRRASRQLSLTYPRGGCRRLKHRAKTRPRRPPPSMLSYCRFASPHPPQLLQTSNYRRECRTPCRCLRGTALDFQPQTHSHVHPLCDHLSHVWRVCSLSRSHILIVSFQSSSAAR